ncbi:MAG: hypothetical protein ACRDRZ_12865 [Pseudonocardiaceae bacterium]
MTAALAPASPTPRVTDDERITFVAAVTGTADEVGDVVVPGCARPNAAHPPPEDRHGARLA